MAPRSCAILPASFNCLFPYGETLSRWRQASSLAQLLLNQLNSYGTMTSRWVFPFGVSSRGSSTHSAFQTYCSGSGDAGVAESNSPPSGGRALEGLGSQRYRRTQCDVVSPGSVDQPTSGTQSPLPPRQRTANALGRRREAAAAAAAGLPELHSPGLLSVLGAIAGLIRGVGALGGTGLGVGHITFGLQALARHHEESQLPDHPPGRPLPLGAATQAEAERLLDTLELAHGAYRRSAAALAATTCLRAQHVRVWRPEGGSLQPGYYVAVDHWGRRVVWGVRGTRVFSDLLTDLAMTAHPLGVGAAHWGMTHAAHWLIQREAARVAALLRSLGPPGTYRLQFVGHSLGGAVAAVAAVMMREGLVEAARTAAIPPGLISCVAFAAPAVMSAPLAELCRPYVTSVVLNNDIVSRFNATSLARLQEELRGVDWYSELQRTVMDHTLVRSLSTKLQALTSTSVGPTPAPVLPPSAAAATTTAAAASMVQQLSAAVLDSAAFKAAVQALDEWKAKGVAAASDQAEAAMRRQLEVVQAWLQEVATIKRPSVSVNSSFNLGSEAMSPDATAGPAPGDAAADIRRVAEAAAERLRQSVESTLASFTAAAAASKERLSASLPPLPSLPSLPQPHELPLVETAATTAAVTAAAAAAVQPSGLRSAETLASEASWGGATVAGEGGPAVADAADTSAATATFVVPMVSHLMHHGSQELPLLLPPGRILHIRLQTEPQQPPGGMPAADAVFVEHISRTRGGGGGCGGDTAAAATGKAAGPPLGQEYLILELPVGEGFQRLVLGRSAIEEHQCKAYRRVLMRLAFKKDCELEGG